MHWSERVPKCRTYFLWNDLEINVKAAQAMGMEAFQFLDPRQFTSELKSRSLI